MACSHLATTGLAGNGEEELELGWQLVFSVQSVGEVDSSDTAVGVDLNSKWGEKKSESVTSCYKV